jgi:hypothetical protein
MDISDFQTYLSTSALASASRYLVQITTVIQG